MGWTNINLVQNLLCSYMKAPLSKKICFPMNFRGKDTRRPDGSTRWHAFLLDLIEQLIWKFSLCWWSICHSAKEMLLPAWNIGRYLSNVIGELIGPEMHCSMEQSSQKILKLDPDFWGPEFESLKVISWSRVWTHHNRVFCMYRYGAFSAVIFCQDLQPLRNYQVLDVTIIEPPSIKS